MAVDERSKDNNSPGIELIYMEYPVSATGGLKSRKSASCTIRFHQNALIKITHLYSFDPNGDMERFRYCRQFVSEMWGNTPKRSCDFNVRTNDNRHFNSQCNVVQSVACTKYGILPQWLNHNYASCLTELWLSEFLWWYCARSLLQF